MCWWANWIFLLKPGGLPGPALLVAVFNGLIKKWNFRVIQFIRIIHLVIDQQDMMLTIYQTRPCLHSNQQNHTFKIHYMPWVKLFRKCVIVLKRFKDYVKFCFDTNYAGCCVIFYLCCFWENASSILKPNKLNEFNFYYNTTVDDNSKKRRNLLLPFLFTTSTSTNTIIWTINSTSTT